MDASEMWLSSFEHPKHNTSRCLTINPFGSWGNGKAFSEKQGSPQEATVLFIYLFAMGGQSPTLLTTSTTALKHISTLSFSLSTFIPGPVSAAQHALPNPVCTISHRLPAPGLTADGPVQLPPGQGNGRPVCLAHRRHRPGEMTMCSLGLFPNDPRITHAVVDASRSRRRDPLVSRSGMAGAVS